MTIPKELKIGSRIVPVKMASLNGDGLMGSYDPETKTITINKDMSPSLQVETLWHEMIHAIHDFNGTQQAIANEIAASQFDGGHPEARAFNLEESLTNGFSNVLIQAIQDNNLLKLTA